MVFIAKFMGRMSILLVLAYAVGIATQGNCIQEPTTSPPTVEATSAAPATAGSDGKKKVMKTLVNIVH